MCERERERERERESESKSESESESEREREREKGIEHIRRREERKGWGDTNIYTWKGY